jgi:hypothetical protein
MQDSIFSTFKRALNMSIRFLGSFIMRGTPLRPEVLRRLDHIAVMQITYVCEAGHTGPSFAGASSASAVQYNPAAIGLFVQTSFGAPLPAIQRSDGVSTEPEEVA